MRRFLIYLIIFFVSGLAIFFITNNELLSFIIGIFSSALLVIIDHITVIYNRIWLAVLCNTKYRKKLIRFSISYLFKIKVDDKYLLVKGNRLKDQYQPVGGVYKRFRPTNTLFKKYKILDDEHMPIDDISKDDLRVLVPGPNVIKFLKWFNSKTDRELSPEREFREELVNTGIVSKKNFETIKYHYLDTEETRVRFSDYFQCNEILIADIFELDLNEKQVKELRKLKKKVSTEYTWVDAQSIRQKGFKKGQHIRISDTANWIL